MPDEYDLTAQWRTGPSDAIIAFEVYGRRSYGDAYILLIDAGGTMDAGSVTRGGTSRASVIWTVEAREDYSDEWLEEQADIVKRRLAHRWGSS